MALVAVCGFRRYLGTGKSLSFVGHQTRECATICFFLNRGIPMELTAVLTPAEERGYVALNPETGTTTQGETVEEAVANLKEATALYLSEFPLPAPGHPVITMFSIPANA